MLKTRIDKARVFVTAGFKSEGSVLAETVQARSLGIETRLEVESQENPERIAKVIRNAENGCYVLQTILHPVPVERRCALNGDPFDPANFPNSDV
ncbi:MAG: OsmC family protein [Deltaproteobacteria bacterium]|nr:OsmC family protein [Deltaproteobacteria bacterium]